jgi:hypothetical protein
MKEFLFTRDSCGEWDAMKLCEIVVIAVCSFFAVNVLPAAALVMLQTEKKPPTPAGMAVYVSTLLSFASIAIGAIMAIPPPAAAVATVFGAVGIGLYMTVGVAPTVGAVKETLLEWINE